MCIDSLDAFSIFQIPCGLQAIGDWNLGGKKQS